MPNYDAPVTPLGELLGEIKEERGWTKEVFVDHLVEHRYPVKDKDARHKSGYYDSLIRMVPTSPVQCVLEDAFPEYADEIARATRATGRWIIERRSG